MASSATLPKQAPSPEIVVVRGTSFERYPLSKDKISIGRRADRDIVLTEPHVSRDHACIEVDGGSCYIVDLGSTHGTFVNGERIQRHLLSPGDRIDVGGQSSTYITFGSALTAFTPQPPQQPQQPVAAQFLSQFAGLKSSPAAEDARELETLRMFMEAARTLNTSGVVTDVLITLVETALRLTRAERGFVFLYDEAGTLQLAAGRNDRGIDLSEAKGISRSMLYEAGKTASEFLVTETGDDPTLAGRQSIIAHDLRTIVCIPLRKSQFRQSDAVNGNGSGVMGVLYLDSHLLTGKLSSVSKELLRAISREAAALVDNAYLAKAEQDALAYQRELQIASTIQQSLMPRIPSVPFATVEARSLPCRDVGGDFYDVITVPGSMTVIVADVSGKGVSAALLASVLQGAVYPLILQGVALNKIAEMLNLYIYNRVMGQKYATMVMARLSEDGTLEYINCGHVPPVLCSAGEVKRLPNGNLPVGLLVPAVFEADTIRIARGDKLMFVSDGVVEAEDAAGEFYMDERLENAVRCECTVDQLFASLNEFCAGVPLKDDCTALQLSYDGEIAET